MFPPQLFGMVVKKSWQSYCQPKEVTSFGALLKSPSPEHILYLTIFTTLYKSSYSRALLLLDLTQNSAMQSKIYPQGVPENNSNQLELLVSQLMAETAEELESFLMRVKEESEKVSLKLNIKKSKAMASSPTTSWKIDGGKVGKVTDFIFLVSKITADSDCSHEIKRHFFLGRKAMTNLDSLLKSRGIILSIVKTMFVCLFQ